MLRTDSLGSRDLLLRATTKTFSIQLEGCKLDVFTVGRSIFIFDIAYIHHESQPDREAFSCSRIVTQKLFLSKPCHSWAEKSSMAARTHPQLSCRKVRRMERRSLLFGVLSPNLDHVLSTIQVVQQIICHLLRSNTVFTNWFLTNIVQECLPAARAQQWHLR